ncbi:DUF2332 domain-containing protein [Nocardiopsis sp. NRRL B-16309]|uniref:DUF2332 domain-containing protein n=1 Tax=Nocardiopsis sp. NRRL B-16309 TaxID=1519494 RepID=UPI0006C0E1E4|nr:DUF2332 domain-containing protein [Nocardiopsis sp. NRRL B-16309]KOX15799.1 hypothetical protein ADL05_14350 [Nocardiopsis sp. NRRL B-16309]
MRRYEAFAVDYEQGSSPAYAEIARELARDRTVVELVCGLPEGNKRQPNLLLAAVRYLGGPVDTWAGFRAYVVEHWESVRAVVLERRTQTNEVRRLASMLPVLASLRGPLALVEVGASAGLCLYPDRYRYSFDGAAPIGPADSEVLLECATSGRVPVPERVPEVLWRAGIDLDPLDVRSEEDVRWLRALVWPGEAEQERVERLMGAVRVAAADPPLMVTGDLVEQVESVVRRAPAEATVVVMHSAVLPYLPQERARAFVQAMDRVLGHWVANEGWRSLPGWPRVRPPGESGFTLALDGRVMGYTGEHGQSVAWAG